MHTPRSFTIALKKNKETNEPTTDFTHQAGEGLTKINLPPTRNLRTPKIFPSVNLEQFRVKRNSHSKNEFRNRHRHDTPALELHGVRSHRVPGGARQAFRASAVSGMDKGLIENKREHLVRCA